MNGGAHRNRGLHFVIGDILCDRQYSLYWEVHFVIGILCDRVYVL